MNVGLQQGSVLLPQLLAIVIDVATNRIKDDMSQEILYADEVVLIADAMAELHKRFYRLKSALESKGLKVNLVNTKIIMSKIGQINIKPLSKKDQCDIFDRKAEYV